MISVDKSIKKIYDFLFFFFQAEDGIRDLYVTGVQTCALPILATFSHIAARTLGAPGGVAKWMVANNVATAPVGTPAGWAAGIGGTGTVAQPLQLLRPQPRSEERRVGKECRSGRCRDHVEEINA